MKRGILLLLCLAVGMTSFGQRKRKIKHYELDKIRGLFFQPNTIAPFSGLAYDEYPNGKKKMHIQIKKGKIQGKIQEWAKNGNLLYEASYENGQQNGLEKSWHPSGKKKFELNFVDGMASGEATEWYEDGTVKSKGRYVSGKEDGEHKWWYDNGVLEQLVVYKMGVEVGSIKKWYKSKQLNFESNYANGEQDGKTTVYYPNGKKQEEGHFSGGKEHGEARFWSKQGKLLGIQRYEQGTLVADKNYRSGAIKTKQGYLQVFNDEASFFTLMLAGKVVTPQSKKDLIYVIDGKLLHLIDNPLVASEAQEETLKLKEHIVQEVERIKEITKYDIQVQMEEGQTPSGQKYIHWHFQSPSSEDKDQKARTVQQEHYISTICNQRVLSLYGVVTNSDKPMVVEKMLEQIANSLRLYTERIDLNQLAKEIQGK
ncbi:MAG: toxin-antitoxin system YwqK family antitoxin [Saprospiraceae bacterium]